MGTITVISVESAKIASPVDSVCLISFSPRKLKATDTGDEHPLVACRFRRRGIVIVVHGSSFRRRGAAELPLLLRIVEPLKSPLAARH